MSSTSVKIYPVKLNCYVLKISATFTHEDIQSKLSSLKNFDESAYSVALELVELVDESDFQSEMQLIDSLLNQYGLFLSFVVSTPLITGTLFCNKPVVELSKDNTIFKENLPSTLIVNDPVRSGVVIRNCGDIIVNNLVSHNAEIISDGNLHIYAECRGKLIAGADGNKNALIYVQNFNAEYIAIANVFQVIEDKLPTKILNKPVKIFLDDKERINIVLLS